MEWTIKNILLWQRLLSGVLLTLWLGMAVCGGTAAWLFLKRRRRNLGVALVLACLLLGGGVWGVALERRQVTGFLECRNNVRSLARSIEMWGEMTGQHDGLAPVSMAYPANLRALRPDFLADVPRCPVAGTDTYSASYVSSSEMAAFTVFCKGSHHRIGFTWLIDQPFYDTSRALLPPEK